MTYEYRPIKDTDLEAYFDLMNDESLAVNAGTIPHPITLDWTRTRIEERRQGERDGKLADRCLFEDGKLVAMSGYFYREYGLEIGYSVHRDCRGRGLATRAAKCAIQLARDNRCTGPVAATYFQDNPASGRVLKKLGFQKTGETISTSAAREGGVPAFETKLTGDVCLSPLHESDIEPLFDFQLDEDAHYQAAGGMPYKTIEAYQDHLSRAQKKGAVFRTILLEGKPVGYVASFERSGLQEISYWIGREHYGQGYASKAVRLWLETMSLPDGGLYARVANDHPASARVLEKNGFKPYARESYLSEIRGVEVGEMVFKYQCG